MLQKPILSGRVGKWDYARVENDLHCEPIKSRRGQIVGKWDYALVENDLHCEPIKSRRGQIVADFIVEHRIDKQLVLDVSYVTFTPWKLHFDGSACTSGCGVGIIIISPNGAIF
jgi:hypothetical protein